MAQDVTLLGASYEDVPAVELPKTGGGTATFTDVSPTTAGAGDVMRGESFFLADGTEGVGTLSNAKLGQGYGTCATSTTTVNGIRYVTFQNYELVNGGVVAIRFQYDVPASSSLSINNKTVKRIRHRGGDLAGGVIKAGDIAYFLYDGTYYRLLGIDRVVSMLDCVYPVGSYYETSDTTFDPNTAWGGTWVLETEGQVHVSGSVSGTYQVSGAPTDTNDGGNKDAIVPYHRHGVPSTSITSSGGHSHTGVRRNISTNKTSGSAMFVGGNYDGADAETAVVTQANTGAHTHSVPSHNTDYEGSSVTGANMQPYIVVNRWHRTA